MSIDLERKRIGVALVPEGSARAGRGAREDEGPSEHGGDASAPAEGFGTLADKLRSALKPRP